ncbi:MAG: carotenoid oxygenase family protein [Rhodoblastus sp.]
MSKIESFVRDTVAKGIDAVASFNRARLPHDDNAYLHAIHEPMKQELTLEELEVTGAIPRELDGRYLRIGPNPANPDPKGYHWFSGDGMVHGLALRDGKALWYRNRWIRSKAVAEATGLPAAPGPRHIFDTVNTNVVGIAGRAWALVEAGSYPVSLSDTLEEQAYERFGDTLQGSFTAHPHRDPLTGEFHGICYEGPDMNKIRHVVVSAEGRVVRELPVGVEHGPSIHDCAITQRYVVILDLPVTFSVKALLGGHKFPYRWNREHKARVGLLPRNGGADEIVWIDCPPVYIFHVANAYDDSNGDVVIDSCVYETMFAGETGGPDGRNLGLQRWTIDPRAKTIDVRTIDSTPQEFPRPDERRFGQPYRYAFTMALPDGDFAIARTQLFKHDLETGKREVHDFGANRHPGEFVFAPRSDDAPEGDGWLIGLVVDMNDETTELVIIDATKFEEEPIARVKIPHRVPPGFHGNWVADADMRA